MYVQWNQFRVTRSKIRINYLIMIELESKNIIYVSISVFIYNKTYEY